MPDGTCPPLPTTFEGFRDLHRGATIVVCGCGRSLNELGDPSRHITIGVNDVGRLFDPTYLVVLNPRTQFARDRFRYVEESRARALFTQLDLKVAHPHVVRLRLGRRGGVNFTSTQAIDYTSNSPYVAVLLAMYMGAARVGLIGVDFTTDHFFAPTGRHPLDPRFREIDREYQRLAAAAAAAGVEIVNLSASSRLTALRRGTLDQLEETGMRIMVERRGGGVVGAFMDAFAEGARRAGIHVERSAPGGLMSARNHPLVAWNGRHVSRSVPAIFCEHGWLPRWAFQVSHKGINADAHLAPFRWNGEPLDGDTQQQLEVRLAEMRRGCPFEAEYMQPDSRAVTNVPPQFLLVPLQMERDTNIIRHVPAHLRSMQAFVDAIARANPPLPLVIKQHPADRSGRHLRVRTRRPQDVLRAHHDGNIHQLLKSGRCRGIISLNSNVVHDGILWNVPSIVLGRNIWPRDGVGPFMTTMPDDWPAFLSMWEQPERRACRDAYAWYLMQHQWTLEDARDPARVVEILGRLNLAPRRLATVTAFPRAAAAKRINVVAANRSWLFEDLKSHFKSARVRGADVIVSDRAHRDADAWIFLRAREAAQTPDAARTVVQIHDLADAAAYLPGAERAAVAGAGAIVFTHPAQRAIVASAGVSCDARPTICRPLGAMRRFTVRAQLPARFSVGWVGRPAADKCPERLLEVLDTAGDAARRWRVVLIGERLDAIVTALARRRIEVRYVDRRRHPVAVYPRHYHEMDALLVTDRVASGPNALFEALATGVPVVGPPVGWLPDFIVQNVNGVLCDTTADMARALMKMADTRGEWFARRGEIRRSLGDRTVEDWIGENIALALRLAERRDEAAGPRDAVLGANAMRR